MLTVYLFGKPEAHIEANSPITFKTLRMKAIVSYLVAISRPITHTEIATLFWSKLTEDEALAEWQKHAATLQSLLGKYLVLTPDQVAFNRQEQHWVDLYAFEELLADQEMAAEQKLEKLRALYRGDLMQDSERTNGPKVKAWLYTQRQTIQTRVQETLQTISGDCVQHNNFSLGQKATHWWLMLNPTSELAHRQRMLLFWHSKQRSAALLQYNRCVEALAKELGTEPSEETRALYEKIQNDAIPLANGLTSQMQSQPSHPRHNLPLRLTPFVGREEEVKILCRYLLTDQHPIVSIMGEGGVGKTRLAIAVVKQIVEGTETHPFSAGCWFVSCGGIDAGESARQQLIISIGATIGMPFQGANPIFEQLANYLANKAMLLVIDSVEHLSDQLDVFWSLLQHARGLSLLFTSRHDLNIQGDKCLRLDGLSMPPFAEHDLSYQLSEHALAQLLQMPSVQLFYERARKITPAFTITQQNGVAMAKLCRLLDGNPLVLELAATLASNFDLATLYNELTHNYTLLSTDLKELPARQRSVYNTIDYSWRLLPPTLATLLAQCSVFRGTFSFGATTTITEQSINHITQLIRRSLLHSDELRHLHIHEMVRQFAAQKLALNYEQLITTHQKHSEYYINQLSTWWNDTKSKHIVSTLLPHLDNIYGGWEWAFRNQHFELLSRAIIPFTQFHIYAGLLWDIHLRVDSYYQKLQELMAQEPEAANQSARHEFATALNFSRAVFQYYLSNYEQAHKLFDETYEQVRQHGYWYLAANIEYHLANFCALAQQVEQAQHHFEQAIHHAEQQQQPYSRIRPLLYLAVTSNVAGSSQHIPRYLQQAYELLQAHPDVNLEATYHGIYGDLYHAQGRWSDAEVSYQQSIRLLSAQKQPLHDFHTLGKILWQSGRYEQAKEFLEQVDSTNKNDFYRPGTYWHTVWLLDFANLYVAWEQPEQALFYSQLAGNYAEKQGQKVLLGRAQKAAGAAQRQLDQWDEARQSLNQALGLFRQESALDHECTALTQLIQLHVTLEDEEEIQTYANDIWNLLHSGKLDMTNAEPTKAWWACYLAFRALHDPRAEAALRSVSELFQTQQANIYDEAWRNEFSTQIVEHRELLRVINSRR